MLRRRLSWRLAALPALLFAVSACEDSTTDPPAPVGVGSTVEEDANLSTLSDLLSDAGLLTVLNSGGPYTLFAPTNAAFSALPAATLEAVLADDDLLEAVLLNHVVQGEFPASGLTNGQTLQTLGGGSLTVSIQGGTVRIGDAVVSEADREASNGVIHVINAVLVPELEPELPDLVDTAVEAGFSTLVSAVQAAGLEETLRGDGPFTVFAPTNAAFDALPDGALEDLLADPDALAEILTYHVVPGRVTADQLSEGLEVETVEGRTLRFTLAGGAQVDGVDITSTDIETSNGIIHVIDAVLMPPVDIVETAIRAGFGTLVAAVQAAGLEETLFGEGPFTVFAPTDEAFDALPEGALDDLLADPDALADVLTYHVVPGRLFAADLTDGQELTTVQGQTLRVTLEGGAQINGVDISATDVRATNGIIHVIDAVLMPLPDLVDTAVDAGFSTLVTAVQAAGLEETLRGDGPFTVFAPTNAAFDALPEGALDDLLADPEALAEILTYHVVPGRVTADQLSEGLEVETVEGRTLRFTLEGGAQVNGVDISATDIETANGIIHVIDAVLMPPVDIVDTAIEAGFSTLVAAVQAAGLEETLRGEGPFTVFAPTDAAFADLPEGALEDLLADPDALAEILTYHVVPGRLFAADLTEGQELTTVQGETIVITLEGGAQVNGVDISAADVRATNGIIHVIDAVLMP